MRFRDVIEKKFAVTVELELGKNVGRVKDCTKQLRAAHAFNIPDGPMAQLRPNAVMLAAKIQQETGVETIAHFSGRDRSLLGLQADLLGADALGVRNVLALTGDSPALGDFKTSRPVFDLNARGILKLISGFNEGKDNNGKPLGKRTDFFAGATANPCRQDFKLETQFVMNKFELGARFFQTQPVFEAKTALNFFKETKKSGVPVLLGLMPLKSYEMAEKLAGVPGIVVPKTIMERMRGKGIEEGVKIAVETVEALKEFISGIHIMPFSEIAAAEEIIESV